MVTYGITYSDLRDNFSTEKTYVKQTVIRKIV